MKTKYFVAIFAVILALCIGLSLFFLMPRGNASAVEIWSDGVLIDTWSLDVNQSITVGYADGYNVVTVKDGKVAVTEATCPDHYCMKRGFCNSGTEIVCLPNRMTIRFLGTQEIDAIIG